MNVSKKNVISIRKFMSNYLLKEYDGDRKLTHYEMNDFLCSKGIKIPKRVSFKSITKLSLLNGNVLLVMDETNRVFPYLNPLIFNNQLLLKSLNTPVNKEQSKSFRTKYLLSKGLIEENGEIVNKIDTYDENDITENRNRIKKLSKRR